jgi:hypothetical protein
MTSSPSWKLPGPGRAPDLAVVQQALRLLADPSAGVQLTCAPAWSFGTFPGTEAGIGRAVAWVGDHGEAEGIYYGLNPVAPDLSHRMKVPDVLRRRWLLIDVDRAKTAENKSLSATVSEHEEALSLAEQVREYLHGQGWPEPGLHLDSGNGAHLLYRIDLPNDPETQKILRLFLRGLAERFGQPNQLDCAVHDARRISKLPGTWARKGPHTRERPHRIARILSSLEDTEPVSADLIRQSTPSAAGDVCQTDILPLLPPTSPPTPTPAQPAIRSPWLLKPPTTQEVREAAWARQALIAECEKMRSARPGGLNNQLFASGSAMGNLVGAGLLDEAEVIQSLLDAGRAAGCDDPKRDRNTIERGIATGKQTPRTPAPLPVMGQSVPAVATATRKGAHPVAEDAILRALGASATNDLLVRSIPDIMSSVFAEPKFAVHGIVAEGLTLLAGKPKLGKSWLALNLALTIAAGGVALGNVPVVTGPVLYLALEDRFRRIQSRTGKILTGLGMSPEASARLDVAVDCPRLDAGGLDRLCEWIERQGFTGEGDERSANARLIIIDVWAKFRPLQQSNKNAYDQDYAHMTALKNILDYYRTSALVLHHTRKAAAQDAIDEVSGTTGIAGCADGIMVLSRARAQEGKEFEAELMITSRDADEQKLALVVDRETWVWTSQGSAAERGSSRLNEAIIRVLRNNAGSVMSTKAISDCLAIDPPPSMHHLRSALHKLAANDRIERVRDGHYRFSCAEGAF